MRSSFNRIGIDSGQQHCLIINSGNTVYGIGYNGYGQLGISNTTTQYTHVQVTTGASDVGCGSNHSVIVKNGYAYTCGYNGYGQLSDNTVTNQTSMVQAKDITGTILTNIVACACGWCNSFFIRSDGTAYSSGLSNYGQCCTGSTSEKLYPARKIPLSNIKGISASNNHTVVLTSDGIAYACGYNGYGQIGIGNTTNQTYLVRVLNLPNNIISVAAGENFSLFLTSDGYVYGCGYNGYGQLCNENTTNQTLPVKSTFFSGVSAIDAGWNHSIILKSNGSVYTVGYNGYGQLGNGTLVNTVTPYCVKSSGVSGVCASYNQSFFLRSSSVTSF